LGIALATRLGIPPVQYATIRALHLSTVGRYGQAGRWLEREIADDEHPFGRAFRDWGLAIHLFELGAFARAADVFETVIEQGTRLNRGWMRQSGQVWLARARLRAGTLDE